MKVAVSSSGPDRQSEVEPCFGRAAWFVVVDTEGGHVAAYDNAASLEAALGAGLVTARNLAGMGIDLVVTGRVGSKACRILEAAGVTVLAGVSGTVDGVIRRYRLAETVAN